MITTVFNLARVVCSGMVAVSDFMLNDWLYRDILTIGNLTITPLSCIFGGGLILFLQLRIGKIILDIFL